MKFAAIILIAVAAVSAQKCATEQSKIPACARTCLDGAASKVSCATSDEACKCKAKDNLKTSALACVKGACSGDVIPSISPAAEAFCKCVLA
ncbi:hypothetical protein BT63DRAFT_483873 [Microthyrium microscopicum]|uniref:CFEM domain-containing protein n=1 Tax=Microthyrium microscopicum TaxID=703497 RepID=A0A6A6TWZ8_9PEZI|nr:hypothetical protein BT63DRAFT_483873 [Microthyrium microscopicum]